VGNRKKRVPFTRKKPSGKTGEEIRREHQPDRPNAMGGNPGKKKDPKKSEKAGARQHGGVTPKELKSREMGKKTIGKFPARMERSCQAGE